VKINSNNDEITNSKLFRSSFRIRWGESTAIFCQKKKNIFFSSSPGILSSIYNNNLVKEKLIFMMGNCTFKGGAVGFSHFCLVSRSSIHQWLIVIKAWTGGGCDFRQERRNAPAPQSPSSSSIHTCRSVIRVVSRPCAWSPPLLPPKKNALPCKDGGGIREPGDI
jgi:hypothetical protein